MPSPASSVSLVDGSAPVPVCASNNIIELRQLLAQRFPHLRSSLAPRARAVTFPTGIAALDLMLGGGVARGEFTEFVAPGSGSGSTEVIHQLLRQVAANRQFLALVDGTGSFDVCAVEEAVLNRLLWVRCGHAAEALKAMDLLLRDRNFPVLVLDLKLNPMGELRKITASIWFRYARLLEHNKSVVLVVTPHALVSAAGCRIYLDSALGIEVLSQSRAELLSGLRFTLLRSAGELGGEVVGKAS